MHPLPGQFVRIGIFRIHRIAISPRTIIPFACIHSSICLEHTSVPSFTHLPHVRCNCQLRTDNMFLALVILLAVAAGSWQPAATSTPATVSPAPAVSPVAAPAGELGGGAGARRDQDREFVRGCCARTLYPRLCTAASRRTPPPSLQPRPPRRPSANLTAGTINSLGGGSRHRRPPAPPSPRRRARRLRRGRGVGGRPGGARGGRLDGVERAVAGPRCCGASATRRRD